MLWHMCSTCHASWAHPGMDLCSGASLDPVLRSLASLDRLHESVGISVALTALPCQICTAFLPPAHAGKVCEGPGCDASADMR